MRYCLNCGNLLKKIMKNPIDLPTYECETCKSIKTHMEMKEIEPYEIVKIKEILERLTIIEKELGL